jgi:hypothetical protein
LRPGSPASGGVSNLAGQNRASTGKKHFFAEIWADYELCAAAGLSVEATPFIRKLAPISQIICSAICANLRNLRTI